MMKKAVLTAALLGLCAWQAQATPSAVSLTPGFTFERYSGAAAVGLGLVDASSTLYYVPEKTVGGLQSWLVFFDPASLQRVQATLDFGSAIVTVFSSTLDLLSSQAVYGVDIDGDSAFDDYHATLATGLEPDDMLTWTVGGSTLQLDWLALDPGDHVRVLVRAVPEPSALTLAGLALAAATALRTRRRKPG